MDNNNGNNIFSGLEDLGFKNIYNLDVYKKEEPKAVNSNSKENINTSLSSYLYDKTVTCPICDNNFKARSLKTSSYRIIKKDSDFFINYSIINPYFYDVWICNSCGYTAMKVDFHKIRASQKEIIKKNITPKWHNKIYPDVYDVNIAIERYKLSLLNYTILDSPSSRKAMNCLKIAWMYRILGKTETEKLFLKNALVGFMEAYSNEDFPIYTMNKFTMMYLIGELNRRLNNFDEALRWLGDVITSIGASQRLKNIARDQKGLIVEAKKSNIAFESESKIDENIETKKTKKKGFFSKFF